MTHQGNTTTAETPHIHITAQHAAQLYAEIEQSQSIILFSHTAPDGDSLGSTLGLMTALESQWPNKRFAVISPDPIDAYLAWMPRRAEVITYLGQEEEALRLVAEADLILHVDHNATHRLRYAPLVEAVKRSPARRIIIDHHLDPESGYALYYSYPGTSSTCQVAYVLLHAMGLREHICSTTATLLLTGIMTDTGRFSYGCYSPQLFAHVGELMERGAQYAYIVDALDNHTPEHVLRLRGYILSQCMQVDRELGAAYFELRAEDYARLGITKGDTEGLVNLPLSIEGVDCACFIREDRDLVKLSLRSIGSFPVNQLAEQAFGGGGHLNAAGAEHHGTLEEAKEIYLSHLRRLREQYPIG